MNNTTKKTLEHLGIQEDQFVNLKNNLKTITQEQSAVMHANLFWWTVYWEWYSPYPNT